MGRKSHAETLHGTPPDRYVEVKIDWIMEKLIEEVAKSMDISFNRAVGILILEALDTRKEELRP